MDSSHFWQSFQWLFGMGLEIVHLPAFGAAGVLLTVGLVISLFRQKPFGSGRWKGYYWLVLTQFVFYPAVIAVGARYEAAHSLSPLPAANPVADLMLKALFYLSLVLGVFWIYRLKNFRWFALCFVALLELFLVGGLLVAGMSITGDWI